MAGLWACATAVITDPGIDFPDASTGADGSKQPGGDAGCPQYNTDTDPKHCGSCTKGCTDLQVCATGVCKAACDAPTVKCVSDAGGSCVDTSKDPSHCGNCATSCSVTDAGSLPLDNGNPDAGVPIPDGGWDGGILPQSGSPACDKSACGVTCPPMTTLCSDKICYDTNDSHDHCGNCNTACAATTEWCTAGHCCATGTEYCGGSCVDVLADKNNCGACGNVCPGQQVCSSGLCTSSQPCSTVAAAWCTSKGWKVVPWNTSYPNQPGGSIFCTSDGRSAANDCDTCMTYNQVVWKTTAKDACSSSNPMVAGNVYGGHSPCTCGPNLLSCGSWAMNNCTPN